jgi:hypothetical protein
LRPLLGAVCSASTISAAAILKAEKGLGTNGLKQEILARLQVAQASEQLEGGGDHPFIACCVIIVVIVFGMTHWCKFSHFHMHRTEW